MTRTVHKNRSIQWRTRKTEVRPSWRVLMLLLGLALLVLSSGPFFSFPIVGFWLLPLGIIYLLMLLVLPRMWLIVLPLATVLVDLTPWTGRFSYNEFDYLMLLTLASGLLYRRYRVGVFAPSPAMLVAVLYLAVVMLGYTGWSYFVFAPQASYDNPYYTPEYAYKVARGLIWGVALVPMWGYHLAKDKRRAVTALITGQSIAAVALGVVVLWERGTLGVLVNSSAWYHIVNSLLDFSSSYRVTALFADMHTGGTAIDGVILLLLPATLYGVLYGHKKHLRLLAFAGFLGLAYVTLVGFTRATYVAFAAGTGLYLGLSYWYRRVGGRPLAMPVRLFIASMVVGLIGATISYKFAGSTGLASYGALLALAFVGSRMRASAGVRWSLLAAAIAIGGYAIHAHFHSRWVEPSWGAALLISVALGATSALGFQLFRRCASLPALDRWLVLAAAVLLPVLSAFALGGYQFNDRLSQAGGDLDHRLAHWGKVIHSADGGFFGGLLGSGVGQFPNAYITAYPEAVADVGSFRVVHDDQFQYLRIGGGRDLVIGQRVRIEPDTLYTFDIRLRAEKESRLVVALCERNVIYASNFMPNCEKKVIKLEDTEGAFRQQSVEINSGKVGGRGALGRWPTMLALGYRNLDAVLDIDDIRFSANGFNLLQNSSFSRGLDNWFYYYDFSHLAWHVKNIFLQLWFEVGWLGLGLFFALLGLLIKSTLKQHAEDSLAPVYLIGVLTMCLFGLFSNPLDSARVSWLFYFYLFAGLAGLRVVGTTGRHRPGV